MFYLNGKLDVALNTQTLHLKMEKKNGTYKCECQLLGTAECRSKRVYLPSGLRGSSDVAFLNDRSIALFMGKKCCIASLISYLTNFASR